MNDRDPDQGVKRAVSVVVLIATALAALLAAVMNDLMVFVLSCLAGFMLLLPRMVAGRTR